MNDTAQALLYLEKQLNANRCHHYEIYCSQVNATSFEVKQQQVDCYSTAHRRGLSMRLLKDNRLGFGYTTELTEDSLVALIERARASSSYAAPDDCNGFPERPGSLPDLNIFDPTAFTLPQEDKIAMLKRVERDALDCDRRITKVRKATYHEQMASHHLINSQGVRLTRQSTLFSASVIAVAEDRADSQTGWDFTFSRHYHDLETDAIGTAAGHKALSLLGAGSPPSYKGPVVLDSAVSYQFLSLLAPSFLAESVQKQKSLLRGKLNQKLFSDTISIIDDGLYPRGMATAPFDGEGVVRQSTPLVEQGVLIQYLYDTYCANKDHVHSTGNASRGSIASTPTVGCSNLFIQKGTVDPVDLLSALDAGFLVTEVMGLHTANPITGDFSLGATGFLVKSGKKAAPFKGMALAGNVVTLFNSVHRVGCDLRFYGTVGAPTLLIGSMEMSGA